MILSLFGFDKYYQIYQAFKYIWQRVR